MLSIWEHRYSYGICFGTVAALQNSIANISTPNILSCFFLSTPEGLKLGIFYVVDHDYKYIIIYIYLYLYIYNEKYIHIYISSQDIPYLSDQNVTKDRLSRVLAMFLAWKVTASVFFEAFSMAKKIPLYSSAGKMLMIFSGILWVNWVNHGKIKSYRLVLKTMGFI